MNSSSSSSSSFPERGAVLFSVFSIRNRNLNSGIQEKQWNHFQVGKENVTGFGKERLKYLNSIIEKHSF